MLTEGITPNGQFYGVTAITATVVQYGGYITLTDMLNLTAYDNNMQEVMKLLASQAGQVSDKITRDILAAGTNVSYADHGNDGNDERTDLPAGVPSNLRFPVGKPNEAFAQYFIGKSYLAPLTMEQIPTFNVTFEPGCRNNWHIHHAKSGGGQMLICIGGRGYYQEWGKEAVEMTPGTVINIPAEVKHWHGAAPDSWFSHLALEIEGEEASNEWLEAVADEDYDALR